MEHVLAIAGPSANDALVERMMLDMRVMEEERMSPREKFVACATVLSRRVELSYHPLLATFLSE
ncbi:MAG: hypothetical protein H6716_23550 [Polyangiaceae bacterium]|nr:hypothetical protein [Polyangiaceae bacterium]